jgi:hypothetical protein
MVQPLCSASAEVSTSFTQTVLPISISCPCRLGWGLMGAAAAWNVTQGTSLLLMVGWCCRHTWTEKESRWAMCSNKSQTCDRYAHLSNLTHARHGSSATCMPTVSACGAMHCDSCRAQPAVTAKHIHSSREQADPCWNHSFYSATCGTSLVKCQTDTPYPCVSAGARGLAGLSRPCGAGAPT